MISNIPARRESDPRKPEKERNMRHSKVLSVFVLMLAFAFACVGVGSATADPTGSKGSAPLTVTCGDTTYLAS